MAEDEIEEIKYQLKKQDLTLYQVIDVKPTDTEIPWKSFTYNLEDNLRGYWIQLSSDKERLSILKLYLCEGDNHSIEVKRLNKIFDIEHKRVNDSYRKDSDDNNMFEEEKSKFLKN